jgi:hypothetical protein
MMQVSSESADNQRLAIHAFQKVLQRRQSKYGEIIKWLDSQIDVLSTKKGIDCTRMKSVARELVVG